MDCNVSNDLRHIPAWCVSVSHFTCYQSAVFSARMSFHAMFLTPIPPTSTATLSTPQTCCMSATLRFHSSLHSVYSSSKSVTAYRNPYKQFTIKASPCKDVSFAVFASSDSTTPCKQTVNSSSWLFLYF